MGADVIVPHRMLKNHVIERTGIQSYALFSEAAAEAANLYQLAYPLVPHSEVYEHIGEVDMQVLDLRVVWEREQEKHRFVLSPEDAWLTFEWDTPHPLSAVWEYLTTPRLEQQWAGYDRVERTDSLGGRMRAESTYHCAHGDLHFFNKILDWKPFEYISLEQTISIVPGAKLIETRRVQESATGTKIIFIVRKPDNPVTEEQKQFLLEGFNQYVGGMLKQLDIDFNQLD